MSDYKFNPNQEQWKEIPGFPGYKVSDHGQVMSFKHKKNTGKLLIPTKNSNGYLRVRLYKKTICIHRLVLIAFKGYPSIDKNQTRHLDGTKVNNRFDNLEWGTNKDNVRDSINHGTFYHHPVDHSKLNRRDIFEIKDLLACNLFTPKQIGSYYNVSKRTINRLRHYKSP